MPRPENSTVYGGIKVSAEEKQQLETQPNAQFIYFKPEQDGTFSVLHRLPDIISKTEYFELPDGKMKGRSIGEIRCREAYNYYIKGYIKNISDPDGTLSEEKYSNFDETLGKWIQSSKRNKENIMKAFDIPEEDYRNFIDFCKSDVFDVAMNPLNMDIEGVLFFQGAIKRYEEQNPKDPELEEFIVASYKDFQNHNERIKALKDIDPKKEEQFLLMGDCGVVASAFRKLGESVNLLRESKGQPPLAFKKHDIDMSDMEDKPKEHLTKAFSIHSTFVLDVSLKNAEGKDEIKKLSLETTAAPSTKLYYCDDAGSSASGIYTSLADLNDFHRKRNMISDQHVSLAQKVKKDDEHYRYKVTRVIGSYDIEKKMLERSRGVHDNYEQLRADIAHNDSAWIRSSREFREMKAAFERLRGMNDSEERDAALLDLKKKAGAYIDYKDPKGDSKKNMGLSDYAKARLKLGKEIFQYACSGINEKEDIRNEIRETILTGLAEEMAHSQVTNRANLGKEILSNPATRKKYVEDMSKDSALNAMLKGKTTAQLLDMSEKSRDSLLKEFKNTRVHLQKRNAAVKEQIHPTRVL